MKNIHETMQELVKKAKELKNEETNITTPEEKERVRKESVLFAAQEFITKRLGNASKMETVKEAALNQLLEKIPETDNLFVLQRLIEMLDIQTGQDFERITKGESGSQEGFNIGLTINDNSSNTKIITPEKTRNAPKKVFKLIDTVMGIAESIRPDDPNTIEGQVIKDSVDDK